MRMCSGQALVYIEDTAADNDGSIGQGIDVMVPTNGPRSQEGEALGAELKPWNWWNSSGDADPLGSSFSQ